MGRPFRRAGIESKSYRFCPGENTRRIRLMPKSSRNLVNVVKQSAKHPWTRWVGAAIATCILGWWVNRGCNTIERSVSPSQAQLSEQREIVALEGRQNAIQGQKVERARGDSLQFMLERYQLAHEDEFQLVYNLGYCFYSSLGPEHPIIVGPSKICDEAFSIDWNTIQFLGIKNGYIHIYLEEMRENYQMNVFRGAKLGFPAVLGNRTTPMAFRRSMIVCEAVRLDSALVYIVGFRKK